MEKCNFCKTPINNGIQYVDRLHNKSYTFCSDSCANFMQAKKGIYLEKSGGVYDKVSNFMNNAMGKTNSFIETLDKGADFVSAFGKLFK